MLFNSLTFVVFFVVVLAVYRILPGWTAKKGFLLLASYVFYGAWNPPFAGLLVLSTLVDWLVAARMNQETVPAKRRALLLVSLLLNLGMLGYFKYGRFVLENFVALVQRAGFDYQPAIPSIVLPVGISFYTFQTLSYTIDVYRKELPPTRSFLDFAFFVSFFPQLVAGPIVRAADFLPQCHAPRHATARDIGWGLFLLTLGLFEKVVLADGMLADTADAVFNHPGPVYIGDAWLGVIAFAGQIFCDFAGYSTCAIGAALCFGFVLPNNFAFPYASVGLRDFWRRWHMSLSTWLRDYLYIPLGGNRRRTAFALMATMLLGGLWHGASWNFVVWGALHGLSLVVERRLSRALGDKPWVSRAPVRLLLGVLTYVLVCFGWVFFRAKDLPTAGRIHATLLGLIPAKPILTTLQIIEVGAVTALIIGTHVAMRARRLEDVITALPAWLVTLFWAAMLGAILLMQGAGDAFLYFQF